MKKSLLFQIDDFQASPAKSSLVLTSSTPDLAAAMETMKAALAAKQKDTPVMEMFNTLFESVVSVILYTGFFRLF